MGQNQSNQSSHQPFNSNPNTPGYYYQVDSIVERGLVEYLELTLFDRKDLKKDALLYEEIVMPGELETQIRQALSQEGVEVFCILKQLDSNDGVRKIITSITVQPYPSSFHKLPNEMKFAIINKLGALDLVRLREVSTDFSNLVGEISILKLTPYRPFKFPNGTILGPIPTEAYVELQIRPAYPPNQHQYNPLTFSTVKSLNLIPKRLLESVKHLDLFRVPLMDDLTYILANVDPGRIKKIYFNKGHGPLLSRFFRDQRKDIILSGLEEIQINFQDFNDGQVFEPSFLTNFTNLKIVSWIEGPEPRLMKNSYFPTSLRVLRVESLSFGRMKWICNNLKQLKVLSIGAGSELRNSGDQFKPNLRGHFELMFEIRDVLKIETKFEIYPQPVDESTGPFLYSCESTGENGEFEYWNYAKATFQKAGEKGQFSRWRVTIFTEGYEEYSHIDNFTL